MSSARRAHSRHSGPRGGREEWRGSDSADRYRLWLEVPVEILSRHAFRWCVLNPDVDKMRERETEVNHGTEANQGVTGKRSALPSKERHKRNNIKLISILGIYTAT